MKKITLTVITERGTSIKHYKNIDDKKFTKAFSKALKTEKQEKVKDGNRDIG
jgi:hypothetical protein